MGRNKQNSLLIVCNSSYNLFIHVISMINCLKSMSSETSTLNLASPSLSRRSFMSLTSYTPRIKCIMMDRAFCAGQDSDFPNVYEVIGEPAIVLNGVPCATSGGSRADLLDTTGNQEASDDPCFGEWMEGRNVRKLFGDQYYDGKVESYDAETNWYRVVYEDGDFEDLYWHELEEVLVPLDISVPLTTLALHKYELGKSAHGSKTKTVKARKKDRSGLRSALKTPDLLQISKVAEPRDGNLVEGNLYGSTRQRTLRLQSSVQTENTETSSNKSEGDGSDFESKKSTITVDASNGPVSESSDVFEVIGEPAILINGVPDVTLDGRTYTRSEINNVKMDNDPCFGEWLEGRKIQKLFGDRYYSGKVEKYDSETKWYRVVYEDGDFEDLYWHELEELLVPLDISIPLTTLALQMFKSEKESQTKKTKKRKHFGKMEKTSELLPVSQVGELSDGNLVEVNVELSTDWGTPQMQTGNLEPRLQLIKLGKDAITSVDDQNGENMIKTLEVLPSPEGVDMNSGLTQVDVHIQGPIKVSLKGQGASRKQSWKTARAEKQRRIEKTVVEHAP